VNLDNFYKRKSSQGRSGEKIKNHKGEVITKSKSHMERMENEE
jgi:hypothetical protein